LYTTTAHEPITISYGISLLVGIGKLLLSCVAPSSVRVDDLAVPTFLSAIATSSTHPVTSISVTADTNIMALVAPASSAIFSALNASIMATVGAVPIAVAVVSFAVMDMIPIAASVVAASFAAATVSATVARSTVAAITVTAFVAEEAPSFVIHPSALSWHTIN
jgi:hypothetical protein